jgi:hypothetical protein
VLSSINLNPFQKKIKEGISLFTAVKNRNKNLEEALRTWILLKEIDEIIILDWSSDESLKPLIEKYQNGKLILAIVHGQKEWILSHAYNLAARLTTRKGIFKVDADVKVFPNFFETHGLAPGIFYSGYYKHGRTQNERHLNGVFFIYRDDFFAVNGFNETIKSYGWDDSELYQRLQILGLKRVYINNDTLSHIQHQDRHQYQEEIFNVLDIPEKQISEIKHIANQYTCERMPIWDENNKMLDFQVMPSANNILLCVQRGDDKNIPPKELQEQGRKNALLYLFSKLKRNIPRDLLESCSHDELLVLYDICFNKDRSLKNKILYKLFNRLS